MRNEIINYLDKRYYKKQVFLKGGNDKRDTNVILLKHFKNIKPTIGTTKLEDSLQKSKTQAIAYIIPSWTHTDSAIPDLPDEAFPALIEESKATAFFTLKQMINDKAEQKSQRQNRWLSRKVWRVNGGINYPNFGRK